MQFATLAFVAGTWLCQQLGSLPGGMPLLLVAAGWTGASYWTFRCGVASPSLRTVLVCILAALAGFQLAALRAHVRLADALPLELEGRPLSVTGVVADLPVEGESDQRFAFDVEEASGEVPRRILLRLSASPAVDREADDSHQATQDAASRRVRPGERWRFTVVLSRPHGAANPHGTDYEATLFERGVRATGRILHTPSPQRLEGFVWAPMALVHRLRDQVRERFREAIPGREYAGVLIALAVGDQQAIPQAQWEVFRRTGIAHLVSISGLHVSMVGVLVGWIVGWRWRRVPRRVSRIPAIKAATAAGLLAAAAYAALAGLAIPTQRSLIMLAVLALAILSGREIGGTRVLALALLCVVGFDPWAVLSPGFWLSFGAVAIIMHLLGGRVRRPGAWRAALVTQLGITLATIPALLGLFNAFSLISPLANAFAIPVVSFAITPVTLLAMVLPAAPLLKLAHGLTALMMVGLEWLASLPQAMWEQAAAPGSLVMAATLGVLWMLLPRGTPGRFAGALAVLPLLGWSPQRPAEGEFRLTVLDVGQGTAVHVQTATRDLVYDAGPAYGSRVDAGARVVVPYLRAQGVVRLDRMVVSHDDLDHSGGVPAVLGSVAVGEVVADAAAVRRWASLHDGLDRRCEAGLEWAWDGVAFSVLAPKEAASGEAGGNNASCVLRIATAGGRVLLAGDIERAGEQRLVETAGSELAAQVVVVPHHGSRSSSSQAFVDAADADAAIFSVGYRNRYGHPHPEVVRRWSEAGAQVWRSDRHGAITVHVGPRGPAIIAQRAAESRYWHGR